MTRHTIVLLTIVAIVIGACGGGSSSPSPTPTPEASASPPVATATAAGPRTINGLFTEPRPSPVDETRRLGPLPETFPVWNGTSAMLYDVQTGAATDLGPGALGRFSPDSTRMVWIASPTEPFGDGEAWMVDVRTLEKRDLGPGRLAAFIDDEHVNIAHGNSSEDLDLATGARAPGNGLAAYQPIPHAVTPEGYVLAPRYGPVDQGSTFTLSDPRTGMALLQFDATAATPAGSGAIAVAAPSVPVGPPDQAGYRHVMTNIFLVDIASGEATFVATAGAYLQFPLVADGDYVVWTDNYCDEGHTRIYDRATKQITEVEASLWLDAIADRLLLEGAFGGRGLVDVKSLQYVAAIPVAGDSSWSPDHRYASLGQYGGHGGLCM